MTNESDLTPEVDETDLWVVPEAPTISEDPAGPSATLFRISVILTGGTISKTYDQRTAVLANEEPVAKRLIQGLHINGAKIKLRELLNKDSLELTEEDSALIVKTVALSARRNDAVVVVHGTDRMSETADHLVEALPDLSVPVILTGAMTPAVIEGSDGRQNLTEALFAARLLTPGVYIVFHGQALRCPGVEKDPEAMTFRRALG
ncbi:MAG: asparaginase domain-containing protein [Pseudomonadota bacterium]